MFSFFKFLLKIDYLIRLLDRDIRGEHNYQHPAIIGRPEMQSARHSGCLPVLFDLTNAQCVLTTASSSYI